MRLPPLPIHPERLTQRWSEEETKVLQAYGQACREQALEEAAKVCRLLADCEENTTDYRNGAAWCAEKIRSLK